ncbi:MAG: hypothetical protein H7A23_03205 [Leptospiraceae bacterium]|nr:hypothetical protein [Leptospiraceae bacterium]MCP5493538.1 hypothetical protein [Leptospiraceae bacterium]
MLKVIITAFSLILFQTSIMSMDTFTFRKVSDSFFERQVFLLKYGSKAEKIAAVEALRSAGTKSALRPLILSLKGMDIDPKDMSGYKNPKQYGVFRANYPNDAYFSFNLPEHNAPLLKFFVARAIAEIGDVSGIEPLIEVYNQYTKTIQDPNKFDDPVEAAKYRPTFREPEDYKMVLAVGEMLRSIGSLLHTLPTKAEMFEKAKVLKDAMNHENYYIRSSAADGLRNFDRTETIPWLEEALKKEKSDYAKVAYLSAIVSISIAETDHYLDLITYLKNVDPGVRYRASQGVGSSRIESAETFLEQALMLEENWLVRDRMRRDIDSVKSFKYPQFTPRQQR